MLLYLHLIGRHSVFLFLLLKKKLLLLKIKANPQVGGILHLFSGHLAIGLF